MYLDVALPEYTHYLQYNACWSNSENDDDNDDDENDDDDKDDDDKDDDENDDDEYDKYEDDEDSGIWWEVIGMSDGML